MAEAGHWYRTRPVDWCEPHAQDLEAQRKALLECHFALSRNRPAFHDRLADGAEAPWERAPLDALSEMFSKIFR